MEGRPIPCYCSLESSSNSLFCEDHHHFLFEFQLFGLIFFSLLLRIGDQNMEKSKCKGTEIQELYKDLILLEHLKKKKSIHNSTS